MNASQKQHEPYDKIVILSPKSVQDGFIGNLKMLCRFLSNSGFEAGRMFEHFKKRVFMIPFNAWNAYKQLMDINNYKIDGKRVNLENTIFIIDEVHLFVKSVIKVNLSPEDLRSPIRNNDIGNAKRIYDMIRKLHNKKILCLTGTPLAKFTFEMVPLFNLAHRDRDLFTEKFMAFQPRYYDPVKERLFPEARDALLKKLDGLVSYVPSVESDVKVSPMKEILVEMSEGQFKQYVYDYCLELKENGFTNKRNIFGMPFGSVSSFHTKTFQDCIYWNDEMFPSDFNKIVFPKAEKKKDAMDTKRAINVIEKKEAESETSDTSSDTSTYDDIGDVKRFSRVPLSRVSLVNKISSRRGKLRLKLTGGDLGDDDYDVYDDPDATRYDEIDKSEMYDGDYAIGINEAIANTHNLVYDSDNDKDVDDGSSFRHNIKRFKIDKIHCPKIIRMYEDSLKFPGIKCFYFRLTKTYGCETMERLLIKEGYKLANINDTFTSKGKRYVLFTGSVNNEVRDAYKKLINDKRNAHGEYIQYIILSPSGQVGISLHNVRFLGIGTTEFAIATINQIRTRCVRYRSHDMLEPKDRTLEQRIYFMSPNKAYLKKHYERLSKILERTDAQIKDEKHPSIERIIYYNSLTDDKPMQAFRKVLYNVSITEKLFKPPS